MGRTNEAKPLEKIAQKEICDWLAKSGFLFWRCSNVPAFKNSKRGAMFKNGLPDIFVLEKGRLIGLEVKRIGAKLRPEQAEFAARMVLNGGQCYLVRSLEDAQRALGAIPMM